MQWLVQTFILGITAFVATNLDDLVILMLLFAQVNATFRPKHIFGGQYLGFAGLIAASLPGFWGGLIVPKSWIGLLGLVPIAIGLNQLVAKPSRQIQVQAVASEFKQPAMTSLLAPQTYQVAAITFANGGDNIGIYVPLFANSNLLDLSILVSVFLSMVSVWCVIAHQLTRHPTIAAWLNRYGKQIVPFVLIGLGLFILIENGTHRLILRL